MFKPRPRLLLIFLLGVPLFFFFQNCSPSFAPSAGVTRASNWEDAAPLECPGGIHSGSIVIATNTSTTENCTIIGDLAVTGNATLQVNYSNPNTNTFVVRGNVTIESHGKLEIIGRGTTEDTFVIDNSFSQQRSLSITGNGTLKLGNVEFRTQENIIGSSGSVYMALEAKDNSIVIIEGAKLNLQSAWLLAYLFNSAKLSVVNSEGLPTENYVHDSSNLKIVGPTTQTGLWLDAKGASGIINLPDVNSPFTWKIGKDNGLNVGWLLEVENSNPGVGVEIREGTNLEIRGSGSAAPSTGELKIGYFVDNLTENLTGLNAGIQNNVVSPRLKLVNVQLGPVAWQLYAGNNSLLNISNSKVNEIGIYGQNSSVSVSNSILQFAVLGAMAPDSTLTIQNSQIWNQSIEADNNAQVSIIGSHIYGSLLHARSVNSKISIVNSVFHANPSGCTPETMVEVSTGLPLCNPFRATGMPSKAGAGQVTCTNTSGCSF